MILLFRMKQHLMGCYSQGVIKRRSDERMECEKFLVEYGLYDKQKIGYEDFADLINLLSGRVKIDVYCSKCKEKRIFLPVANKIKIPQENKFVRMNVFAEYGDEKENRQIRESMAAQEQREEQERFEQFLKDNSLITLKYVCSKDESHNLTYILFIEGEYIRKIGQYPSYADVDIPQAEVYKKELGKGYYNELKRAIGLYSSNVGIGSYVYLRRILEKIILDGLQTAIADGVTTQDAFELDENNHQRRIEDKIKLLKDYLPKTLVDNKVVYGIMSKGIHELSEEECMKYFPALEQLIKMCLDERIEVKRKQSAEAELQKKINAISSEIKKK